MIIKIPIGEKVRYFMQPRFLMYLRGFVFLYMNNKKSLGVKSCIFFIPLKFGIKRGFQYYYNKI
jgi:hypothetical protein